MIKGSNWKDQFIDFNNITQQPNNINIEDINLNKQMQLNKEDDWYNYNIANWGTKWNAYNISKIPLSYYNIKIDTAWEPPIKVIVEMSKFYTDIIITHYYSDEGKNFMGKAAYNGGNILYNIRIQNDYNNINEYKDIEARCDIANKIYRPIIKYIR